MLASLATLLVVVGTLVLLACNAFGTQLFLAPAPRGDRGVGLIVPFAAMALAALLLTLGSLLAAFRSGRPIAASLPMPIPLTGAVTVIVTFGVALAAIMAFAMWAEPVTFGPRGQATGALLGWVVGLFGPALLATVLLADLWMTPDAFRAHAAGKLFSRGAVWALPLLALLGVGATVSFIAPSLGISMGRARAVAAHDRSQQASLRDRLRTASLATLLREELDSLPADAPFTAYSSYFVGSVVELDDECKAVLVERALGLPDWRTELPRALRGKPYNDRWGAAEFVRLLPEATLLMHEAEFAKAVEEGVLETADDIARRPSWLTEPYDRNHDPLGLIRSLLGAARRFDGRPAHERLSEAIRTLARESSSLKRDKAWRQLAQELEAAGFPIPAMESTP